MREKTKQNKKPECWSRACGQTERKPKPQHLRTLRSPVHLLLVKQLRPEFSLVLLSSGFELLWPITPWPDTLNKASPCRKHSKGGLGALSELVHLVGISEKSGQFNQVKNICTKVLEHLQCPCTQHQDFYSKCRSCWALRHSPQNLPWRLVRAFMQRPHMI